MCFGNTLTKITAITPHQSLRDTINCAYLIVTHFVEHTIVVQRTIVTSDLMQAKQITNYVVSRKKCYQRCYMRYDTKPAFRAI